MESYIYLYFMVGNGKQGGKKEEKKVVEKGGGRRRGQRHPKIKRSVKNKRLQT